MKRLGSSLLVLAAAACNPAPSETVEPAAPAVAAPPLQMAALAVLEHQPGALADQPSRFVVRMVFQNSNGAWKSMSPACEDEACLAAAAATWPPTAAWTVVSGGAVVGKVDATTPQTWTRYADVGTQEVAATADIPKVGAASHEWTDSGVDLQRPLAATSRMAASDPGGWKESELTPESRSALHGAFVMQFKEVSNCATEGGSDLGPMSYAPADIAITATRASTAGWSVATGQLNGYRCDGPWGDTAFAQQTFAISPDGKAKYLGEGLKLVDAGDFDGDGKSELLFAIQRGNTAGYELHFDDFAGHETFAYNHH